MKRRSLSVKVADGVAICDEPPWQNRAEGALGIGLGIYNHFFFEFPYFAIFWCNEQRFLSLCMVEDAVFHFTERIFPKKGR